MELLISVYPPCMCQPTNSRVTITAITSTIVYRIYDYVCKVLLIPTHMYTLRIKDIIITKTHTYKDQVFLSQTNKVFPCILSVIKHQEEIEETLI